MSTTPAQLAKVFKTVKPRMQSEGMGATVARIVGSKEVRNFDPFLLLDHFSGRLPAGFPDHPHRGFETVSYMFNGTFFHEDSKGHKGTINKGDVQWMTAGKGILHAEMPGSHTEDSTGLQLWINLPKDKKMVQPHYQEFTSAQIPVSAKDGVTAKIICGKEFGAEGSVKPTWPAQYVDFQLAKDSKFEKVIPAGWNCLIYLFEGSLEVNGDKFDAQTAVLFQKEPRERVAQISAPRGEAKFVFIGGQPIGEPIVQYGPFVMNTQEEIQQAFSDYQGAKNGFEEARTWKSGIRKLSNHFADDD